MAERDRYYLTTAIFYPCQRPALHSLFEAIGADMIARYQRLRRQRDALPDRASTSTRPTSSATRASRGSTRTS